MCPHWKRFGSAKSGVEQSGVLFFFIAPERERKHSGKGRVWRTAAVTENK